MADDIPPIELRITGFFNDRSDEELRELLREFYANTGLREGIEFEKGMFLNQDPESLNHEREDNLSLSEEERKALERDREADKPLSRQQRRLIPNFHGNTLSKWGGLPWPMWKLVIICAIGAAVQGMDEIAINGAQIWYQDAFRIYISDTDSIPARPAIVGLVNGAPYLCCVFSCFLTPWLNDKLGRRGTIFWCAIFSIVFALAQGFAQTWQQLLAFRLLLGLGIGPKSATCPIYASECAPANIRGSLVMFWQIWTAFGIMMGCIIGVALQHIGQVEDSNICPREKLLSFQCSANWRLILASPAILPIVLAAYIYTCHESPRWTIAKAHRLRILGRKNRARVHFQKAFRALEDMSRDPILAARDMISHYFLLQKEYEELVRKQEKKPHRAWLSHEIHELFFDRRNARATLASTICMFAQQFCGINFIIYYSNIILLRVSLPGEVDKYDFSEDITRLPGSVIAQATNHALMYTLGIGILNLVFAIPAFLTIDTVGRRTLLLSTFPLMALCHTITAIANAVHIWQMSLVGMYLFVAVYSPGEGPVPFVYASESMPLHMREQGMAFSTSVNWLFNFVIAFSGAGFLATFGQSGTFIWYACWCVALEFMILFFVPETRSLTLEQLDHVFREVPVTKFAKHGWDTMLWHFRKGERPIGLYEVPVCERQHSGETLRRERGSKKEA